MARSSLPRLVYRDSLGLDGKVCSITSCLARASYVYIWAGPDRVVASADRGNACAPYIAHWDAQKDVSVWVKPHTVSPVAPLGFLFYFQKKA